MRARFGDGVDAWLSGLTPWIDELVDRWELALSEPLAGANVGYTVAATRGGSEPVVLKLTYPDGWFPEEVAALASWDGDGAIELIDHDPRGAMLLERAVPGTPLRDEADEERAMLLAADVVERLWIGGPATITSVGDEVGRWVSMFRDRNRDLGGPVPRDLADEAVALMGELVASPREELLLHGNLQLGNVLAAERKPWLAIEPRPLVGDREFDVVPLLLDVEHDRLMRTLQRRFDLLAEGLSCDPERLRAWSIAVATDDALAAGERRGREALQRQLEIVARVRTLRA
jgi:streptomycin 6-kinase